MSTKKERKVIKKVIKGYEPMNYVSPPPWELHHTKKSAYQGGFNEGRIEGDRQTKAEFERQGKRASYEEQQQKLKALSDICQAGSNVVEAMSKALLSYMNNL